MNITENVQVIDYIFKNYGYSSVNLWIQSMVDDLLKRTGQSNPPVRLSKLMNICKIKKVVYPNDYISKRGQIRFTLAHEIAHTFFFDSSIFPPQKKQISYTASILEKLCNMIASEILMPKRILDAYIDKYFADLKHNYDPILFIKLVLDSSIKFDINPQVAARCLIDRELIKDTIILGVSWFPKLEPTDSVSSFGKTSADLNGFTIRLNYPRTEYHIDKETCSWRLLWHAIPPSLERSLFIPKKGNPKVHLNIMERLFFTEGINDLLISEEPITNFRLGNLKKVVYSMLGSKATYPVFGKIIKPLTTSRLILKENKQTTEDTRAFSKIILALPLREIN